MLISQRPTGPKPSSHTLLCKMDLSCTALCFSAVSGGELLVGVADNSFRSYDLGAIVGLPVP